MLYKILYNYRFTLFVSCMTKVQWNFIPTMRFSLKDVNLSITNVNNYHPGHTPSYQEIILTKLFFNGYLRIHASTNKKRRTRKSVFTLLLPTKEISDSQGNFSISFVALLNKNLPGRTTPNPSTMPDDKDVCIVSELCSISFWTPLQDRNCQSKTVSLYGCIYTIV